MKDQLFSEPAVLQRCQAHSLDSHINKFAALLSEQGYAKSTTKYMKRLVSKFSEWLQQKQLGIDDINEEQVIKYLKHRERQGYAPQSNLSILKLFLHHLCDNGVILASFPETDNNPFYHVEHRFIEYLEKERGLAQATVTNYVPTIHRFLSERFAMGDIELEELCPADISKFILRHAYTVSPGRAKLMVTALRTFFRFLLMCGEISLELAASVPAVANWRLSELPKALEPEDVERLLKSCDRCNAPGKRDYAILLLLARLGLRAGEVVAMTLDDINWATGELTIRRKGGQQSRTPLVWDVGEALASYIRHCRPNCSTRRVFIRIKAPHVGFSSSVAICNIVSRALKRAGIDSGRKGAHILRHSLAIRLLRNGASFTEIGEVLGHSLPSTTEIYAKVDIDALGALVQPWPGGEA